VWVIQLLLDKTVKLLSGNISIAARIAHKPNDSGIVIPVEYYIAIPLHCADVLKIFIWNTAECIIDK
jgi:hypothetical protein